MDHFTLRSTYECFNNGSNQPVVGPISSISQTAYEFIHREVRPRFILLVEKGTLQRCEEFVRRIQALTFRGPGDNVDMRRPVKINARVQASLTDEMHIIMIDTHMHRLVVTNLVQQLAEKMEMHVLQTVSAIHD